MDIEFDPDKDVENIRRRGIPLAFGRVVLENSLGEVEDGRHDYGETRIKAYGQVEGRWFTCVYTMRGFIFHIITVHKVREKEVRRWLAKN